jgi:hypothetical protein
MPGLIPRLVSSCLSFLTHTHATASAMTSDVRDLETGRDARGQYRRQGKGKENIYHAAGTRCGKRKYIRFLLTS